MSAPTNENTGRVRTTVTLANDTLSLGQELAAADKRSFSNYLEVLIERDAARNKQTESSSGGAVKTARAA